MTPRLLPLVVVAALAGTAHAGTVGIVVTGDPQLQVTLTKQLEGWLRAHGHTVGETLAKDAQSSLLNCMVIDDEGCARGIVDARATTGSVVFAEVRAPRTRASNATTLIVYWFVKGKEPVGMRRACEACTDDLMNSTLDEVLSTVVGASELARGRLELHSRPEGVTVVLDNVNVGITPIQREVPAGQHTIVLMSKGRKVGERKLKIQPEVTAEITMPVEIPADKTVVVSSPSYVLPGTLIAIGGAAVVAGVVLYATSDVDDGTKFKYYDNRPVGMGVGAGGLALTALGALLWSHTGSKEPGPVVATDGKGGYVGWARAF